MMSTMVTLIFYFQFKPLEDPKAQKIEIFNELTMQSTLYIFVFFTELTDEEYEFRNDLGYLYIFLILSNVAVHSTLLFVHSCKSAKVWLKRKCYQKQKKELS